MALLPRERAGISGRKGFKYRCGWVCGLSREGVGVGSSIKGVTYSPRPSLGNSKATGLRDTGLGSPFHLPIRPLHCAGKASRANTCHMPFQGMCLRKRTRRGDPREGTGIPSLLTTSAVPNYQEARHAWICQHPQSQAAPDSVESLSRSLCVAQGSISWKLSPPYLFSLAGVSQAAYFQTFSGGGGR